MNLTARVRKITPSLAPRASKPGRRCTRRPYIMVGELHLRRSRSAIKLRVRSWLSARASRACSILFAIELTQRPDQLAPVYVFSDLITFASRTRSRHRSGVDEFGKQSLLYRRILGDFQVLAVIHCEGTLRAADVPHERRNYRREGLVGRAIKWRRRQMRTLIAVTAFAALLGGSQATFAQPTGGNDKEFCLRGAQTRQGNVEECRFDTMTQCQEAAKGQATAKCVPNPKIARMKK
jgi:hypothetical protein